MLLVGPILSAALLLSPLSVQHHREAVVHVSMSEDVPPPAATTAAEATVKSRYRDAYINLGGGYVAYNIVREEMVDAYDAEASQGILTRDGFDALMAALGETLVTAQYLKLLVCPRANMCLLPSDLVSAIPPCACVSRRMQS